MLFNHPGPGSRSDTRFRMIVKVMASKGRIGGSLRICRVVILCLLVGLLAATHALAQFKTTPARPEPAKKAEYAVMLGNDLLFYVRVPIKGYGPEERAKAI